MRLSFALMFIAAAFTIALAGCAKAQKPGEIRLGPLEIKILADAQFDRDAAILVSPENPDLLQNIPADFKMVSGVSVILAKCGNETVLFDAGLGKESGGKLLDSLQEAQVSPDDITAVFITHLHFDHFGGLVQGGKPSFPNATVYLAQEEADYFLRDISDIPEQERGRFQGAITCFAALESAGIPIVKFPSGSDLTEYFGDWKFSFKSEQAFGHTPGHTIYRLNSDGKEILIWGDILHVIDIQLSWTDISATYDMDTELAKGVRRRVLEDAAARSIVTAGSHTTAPGLFRIAKKGDGFIRKEL
ncbi:MAG: MBL fold metallo-hydrolase [Spirochaetota bacterium]|nr:MBL fold metallo-hydrolase [Spirochaetota bacterium]